MHSIDTIDLPKKYLKTYIRVKGQKDKDYTTMFVENIILSDEDDKYVFIGQTVNGVARFSEKADYLFDFPPVGVVNFGNAVAVLSRFPARQWKKAACIDNFKFYSPLSFLREKIKAMPHVVQFDLDQPNSSVDSYDRFFNNKYYTIEEAVEQLKNHDRVACAINDEFFLTNSHYNNSILIWRINSVVAEYNKNIKVLQPIFKQEIVDLFKELKCQII